MRDAMTGPKDPGIFWSAVLGLAATIPYTAELFGWPVDGDCRTGGGPGTPGCDYGAQYDQWAAEQGVETAGDAYLVPGVIAALLSKKPRRGGCKCFLAGTDVLMADGTTKEIEDVELGDRVLATDPETGETQAKEVTRLIVTEDDKFFNELTISTQEGDEELTATHEHPFLSPSEEEWVAAADLRPGMKLLAANGKTVSVKANRSFGYHARTYNLTVADIHTYYVLARKDAGARSQLRWRCSGSSHNMRLC